MTATLSVSRKWLYVFLGIAALVLAIDYTIVYGKPLGPIPPVVAWAVVLDICLALPVLFTVLVLRKKHSRLWAIPFTLAGAAVCYLLIPHSMFAGMDWKREGWLLAEAAFLTVEGILLIRLLRKLPLWRRTYASYKEEGLSFPFVLRNTYNKVFPVQKKLSGIWMLDVVAWHYLLFSWGKKPVTLPKASSYSYHVNTGAFGIFLMLVHAMLIEVIGVHFLILQMSHVAAWIVTAADILFLLYIIANYQATRLCPVQVTEDTIYIQRGILYMAEIDRRSIQSIVRTEAGEKPSKDAYVHHISGFEEEAPAFKIKLREPITVYGPYGLNKITDTIYITVDDGQRFYEELTA